MPAVSSTLGIAGAVYDLDLFCARRTRSIFSAGGRPNRNSARNLDIYIRTGRIPITKQDNDLQNLLKWAFKAGNHDARFGGGRHQIARVGISTIWSK